jgi:serine protease inhibitor
MNRAGAILLAVLLVAGCSSASPSGTAAPSATAEPSATTAAPSPVTSPAVGGVTLAAVTLPRLATTHEDATQAGSAVNAFALDLYKQLATANPSGDLVVSPTSIALALSMARAGAKGKTATEMDAVMHGLGSDANAAWVAALDTSLNGKTATFKDATGADQQVTLRSVNAPFAQAGYPLQDAYLAALAARFGAGLRLVDYQANPEAARAAINAWVNDQTEQRIPQLLAQGTVDRSTRLTLVNAIYLKAAWQLPFTMEATAPAPFTRLDGTATDVAMMHTGDNLPYATGEGWRAVDLGYVGGLLSMLVIVPDDLAAFERSFDATGLDAIAAALAPQQVILGLPKFGTESQLGLGDVLGAMGMRTAFNPDTADFSGMTTAERLSISAVIHQANIDVDEKGTEAAAATAVAMTASGLPSEPVHLTVDHPFIFALRDLDTGAIVFLGRITEPKIR